MSNSPPEIGDGRKLLYYGGMIASGLGLLVFLSIFLTFVQDLDSMDGPATMRSFAVRAVGGMLLMIVGQAVQRMGARGLAGSGVILDPEQARKDVEPWARLAGGMANDALSEVDLAGRSAARQRRSRRSRFAARAAGIERREREVL